MIEHLFDIERDAGRDSCIHSLDARLKIIISFAAIIAVVSFPYSTAVYTLGLTTGIFFAVLWGFSGLSPLIYIKRFLVTLPFGLFIIFFQIFFENPWYETFTPLVTFPFGINIYRESVEFASILGVKFVICISFIILLSSTTTMQALLNGGRRLGLPSVMALSLGMMIRYLFVFAGMYGRVNASLASRNFNAFDRSLSYRYRLETMGYAVGMFFIRSYEQGERTYISMLCRGYGKDSYEHLPKKSIIKSEWVFLLLSLVFIVGNTVGVYLM